MHDHRKTIQELIDTLKQFPPDQEVELEFKLKTGYDEGSTYTAPPTHFTFCQGRLYIGGPWKCTGGW